MNNYNRNRLSRSRIITVMILSLGIFGLAKSSFAADFHIVQNSSAGDTGTDCTNAHAVSWFNNSSNWANPKQAGKIGPGDTVYLCGTITSALTVQGSGTNGDPITIRFDQGANISMELCPGSGGYSNLGCLATNGNSYIVIDGDYTGNTPCGYVNGSVVACNGKIQQTLVGTSGATCSAGTCSPQTTGIGVAAPSCTGCEIKNLEVGPMYVRTSSSDYDGHPFYPTGAIVSGSNISVHNNSFHDAPSLLLDSWLDGDTNQQIYNNSWSASSHSFVFSQNTISTAMGTAYYHDNYDNKGSTWDSTHASQFHESNIHAWGISNGTVGTGSVIGFYIYNNKLINPGKGMTDWIFLEGGPTGTPWVGETGTAYVFNNLVIGSGISVNVGSNHVIANNTVLGSGIGIGQCDGLTVENNYISGTGVQSGDGGLVYDMTSPPYVVDYNLYAYRWSAAMWECVTDANTHTWYSSPNWSTFLAACPGADQHSINDTCAWGGPCTTANQGGVNQTTGIPASDSGVRGHGANLTGLGITLLNTDLAGVAQPSNPSVTWDIGAYEYVEGRDTTPPAQPTGLVVH